MVLKVFSTKLLNSRKSNLSIIMIPLEVFTHERATNVKPVENSFPQAFPGPTLILSRVRPSDLWIVTQANRSDMAIAVEREFSY